jgi:plastocyanin domain-containing protein
VIGALSAFRRGAVRHAPSPPLARVRVRGGYEPSTVYGRVGQPLRILFRREETAPCSERVVFPSFGKSAMLPAYQDVIVELDPQEAGTFEFTCELGVLRGTLVVEGR